MRIVVNTNIKAPVDRVFSTVADIRNLDKAIPHIVKYEILSETQSGKGTRFIETRLMHGREATTELEIADYALNDRVQMVADSHGSIWDTVFTVQDRDGDTELVTVMEGRPYKLLPRLMNPFIKGMVAKAVEADMNFVKEYCEQL